MCIEVFRPCCVSPATAYTCRVCLLQSPSALVEVALNWKISVRAFFRVHAPSCDAASALLLTVSIIAALRHIGRDPTCRLT
jgi:hypothetical protein